jgi:hypothetical protein
VAVLARADVPLGVERQRAQRARRPAGGDDPLRAGDERLRRLGGDPHAERVGTVLAVGQRLDLGLLVVVGASASTTTRESSPSQASPMVLTRNSSSTGASSGAVSSSSRGHVAGTSPTPRRRTSSSSSPEALGEHLHLHLLRARRTPSGRRLRPAGRTSVAGLADGPGHEAVGRVEDEQLSGHL